MFVCVQCDFTLLVTCTAMPDEQMDILENVVPFLELWWYRIYISFSSELCYCYLTRNISDMLSSMSGTPYVHERCVLNVNIFLGKGVRCIIFYDCTCLETYLFPISSSDGTDRTSTIWKERKKHTLQSKPVKFFITQHKDIWMLKKTRQSSHYKMTKKLCICPLIFLYFIIYN